VVRGHPEQVLVDVRDDLPDADDGEAEVDDDEPEVRADGAGDAIVDLYRRRVTLT
jgi:hypothetical protein